ncbi:glycosyltransferase family 2 protein [Enterococcus sp. AZ102]|uniref:glycosyltransferase family 2 protein n=1 Tax=Enterococcus sp. AZ102 TaxID=2774865 RepID=UPI003F290897
MNNKLSIIITVYNLEKYIDKTLDSIISQMTEAYNLEILVINDGSTDNSADKIELYTKKYAYIKLINKINGGVCSARNLGIKKATGNYILFLDGDDIIANHFLENFFFKRLNIDLMIGSRIIKNKNTTQEIILTDNIYTVNQFLSDMLKQRINFWNIGGYLISREIILENNLEFNENLESAEDLEFFINVIKCVEQVKTTSNLFFYYLNLREDSISLTFSEKKINDQIIVCKDNINYLDTLELDNSFFVDKYIHIVNEAKNIRDLSRIQKIINDNKIVPRKIGIKRKIHLYLIYFLGVKNYLYLKRMKKEK